MRRCAHGSLKRSAEVCEDEAYFEVGESLVAAYCQVNLLSSPGRSTSSWHFLPIARYNKKGNDVPFQAGQNASWHSREASLLDSQDCVRYRFRLYRSE